MGCENSLPVSKQITQSETSLPLLKKPKGSFNQANTSLRRKEIESIMSHFKILKAIGTNRMGTTLYAQELQSGTFRAIREVNKNLLKENPDSYNEFQILKDLDHPNIMKSYQSIETVINHYMVYEYLNGGTLKSTLKRSTSEASISKHIKEVFSALNYLHIQKVVHCNLNPNNIIFSVEDDEHIAKLVGFNYSQKLDDLRAIDVKSLSYLYVSPEMLKKKFTEKTDIWSLGIIVYELLVGKHPYQSKDKHDILKEIYKGQCDFSDPTFLNLSFNAQDFLKKLLLPNPEERLTAKEALDHPWLSLCGKEFLMNYEALLKLRNFKVKSNITRKVLKVINTKIEIKDHGIISVFKNLDKDYNGFVSKDEVVEAFRLVGIDASVEINAIMTNVDIDKSGVLDFTEIKIALTEWDTGISKEVLGKAFKTEDGFLQLGDLRQICNEVLPHEWNDFTKKTRAENGRVSVEKFQEYLLSTLE